MKQYARQPEPEISLTGLLAACAAGAGNAIVRNPVAVGGMTAFLISLAFVSANALWYQPHFHGGALLSTRQPVMTAPREETQKEAPAPRPIKIERPAATSSETTGAVAPDPREAEAEEDKPGGDPTIRNVQTVLRNLDLYRGEVDGLVGPQTRTAIENYRRIVGLSADDTVDDALLKHLGLGKDEPRLGLPEQVPVPTPRPRAASTQQQETASVEMQPREKEGRSAQTKVRETTDDQIRTAAVTEPDPTVVRVQAALRAFGNDGIEIDGMMGQETAMAIREFQSLFGLPITGKVDADLVKKMQEVGLTN